MAKNKIEKLKAKIAELESQIAYERSLELAVLPESFGFESVSEFIKAVRDASRGRGQGPKNAPQPRRSQSGKKTPGVQKTRKRAVITAETRAEVKKLVGAGKSGSQIAKQVGISLPSVQNIKKALGLVKTR